MEPPTSENGIMHISVGVGVVWAVTKDRKVRPGRRGAGSQDCFTLRVVCVLFFCPEPLSKLAKHPALSVTPKMSGTCRILPARALYQAQHSCIGCNISRNQKLIF